VNPVSTLRNTGSQDQHSQSNDMVTFTIGVIKVTSSAVTMRVPSHVDWLDDVDAQGCMPGSHTETAASREVTGPRDARVLDAPISDAIELAAYLETVHNGVTAARFLSAMRVRRYAWGELVALDWTALCFAPGGVGYFLLPHHLPCVDLGSLELDWDTVIVQRDGYQHDAQDAR